VAGRIGLGLRLSLSRRIWRTGLGGVSGLTTTGGSWSEFDCARAALWHQANATMAAEPAAYFSKPMTPLPSTHRRTSSNLVSGRSPGLRSSRDPPSQTCCRSSGIAGSRMAAYSCGGSCGIGRIGPHRIPVSPSWRAPMTIA